MKRVHCLQIAAFAACAAVQISAFSQSGVTIYGIIDSGAEYVNKQIAGGSAKRLVSGAESGSRLGFRGTEDLGGGLRAFFDLESGINVDDGTYAQGGLAFGRFAYVGIGGDWGDVSLGRLAPAANWYAIYFDPLFRPSRYSSPVIDPIYAGRINNMVSYSGNFGSTRVIAEYGFGEVAGASSNRAGRYVGAFGTTTLGDFSVGVAYDNQAGTTVPTQNDTVERTSVAGLYRIGVATLGAGYTDRRNDLAVSPSHVAQYWLGARAQLGLWYLAAAYYASDTKNSPNDARMLSLLTTYSLSKRTDIYLHASATRNSGKANMGLGGFGTVVAGGSQEGFTVGVRHLF